MFRISKNLKLMMKKNIDLILLPLMRLQNVDSLQPYCIVSKKIL